MYSAVPRLNTPCTKRLPMKTLVVCVSWHHENTKKIADEIAAVLHAEVIRPGDANVEALADFDLIGFGAGIDHGKHYKGLLKWVDTLPVLDKNAFVFSTRGAPRLGSYHQVLNNKLVEKGFTIVGEFSCRGFDTNGPLRFIGGIAKGRPNEQDLQHARAFAKTLGTLQTT
jgi:flavodoxin